MRVNLKQTEGIFPMPVLMVATYNEDGSVNVMNAAWGTMQDRDKVALVLTETQKPYIILRHVELLPLVSLMQTTLYKPIISV